MAEASCPWDGHGRRAGLTTHLSKIVRTIPVRRRTRPARNWGPLDNEGNFERASGKIDDRLAHDVCDWHRLVRRLAAAAADRGRLPDLSVTGGTGRCLVCADLHDHCTAARPCCRSDRKAANVDLLPVWFCLGQSAYRLGREFHVAALGPTDRRRCGSRRIALALCSRDRLGPAPISAPLGWHWSYPGSSYPCRWAPRSAGWQARRLAGRASFGYSPASACY